MEENIFPVKVFINGMYDSTINMTLDKESDVIIGYLNDTKYPNNSIAALYNPIIKELDVIKGLDEYATVNGISSMISNYHADIADVRIYAITNTSMFAYYVKNASRNLKILKGIVKKEKTVGLIKRDKEF